MSEADSTFRLGAGVCIFDVKPQEEEMNCIEGGAVGIIITNKSSYRGTPATF